MDHGGERPYPCPECSFTCKTKQQLNEHRRKHSVSALNLSRRFFVFTIPCSTMVKESQLKVRKFIHYKLQDHKVRLCIVIGLSCSKKLLYRAGQTFGSLNLYFLNFFACINNKLEDEFCLMIVFRAGVEVYFSFALWMCRVFSYSRLVWGSLGVHFRISLMIGVR